MVTHCTSAVLRPADKEDVFQLLCLQRCRVRQPSRGEPLLLSEALGYRLHLSVPRFGDVTDVLALK